MDYPLAVAGPRVVDADLQAVRAEIMLWLTCRVLMLGPDEDTEEDAWKSTAPDWNRRPKIIAESPEELARLFPPRALGY